MGWYHLLKIIYIFFCSSFVTLCLLVIVFLIRSELLGSNVMIPFIPWLLLRDKMWSRDLWYFFWVKCLAYILPVWFHDGGLEHYCMLGNPGPYHIPSLWKFGDYSWTSLPWSNPPSQMLLYWIVAPTSSGIWELLLKSCRIHDIKKSITKWKYHSL